MKTSKQCLLILLSCISLAASAQSFNKEMIKAIKKSTGKDLKKFEFFSYPTNSYGVGTLYKSGKPNTFLCGAWNCYNLLPKPDTKSKEWLSLKDYAEVGMGAPIELSVEVTNKWGLDFALPKIFDILKLNLGANKSKVKKIHVKLGNGYVRNIYPDSVQNYIINKLSSGAVKQNFNAHKLVLVYSDFVISSIDITIELEPDFSAQVDAQIGATGNSNTISKIFDGADLKFNIERKSSGLYHIEIDEPLIIARYAAKEKNGGFYSAESVPEQYILNVDESNFQKH